jgi:hypothetical protein
MPAGIGRAKSNQAQDEGCRKQEYQKRCDLTESHCERHRLDLQLDRTSPLNPPKVLRFLYERQTIVIVHCEKRWATKKDFLSKYRN